MNLVDTVPSGHGLQVGRFSFGQTPGLTSYISTVASSIVGWSFNASNIVTFSFPNLTTLDPSNFQGGALIIDNSSVCTSVSAPNLTFACDLIVANVSSIATISFPALVTLDGALIGATRVAFAVGNVPAVTTISFPALVTCNGQFECDQIPSGVTPSFPLLATINGSMILTSCQHTAWNFPSLVTANGNITGSFSPNLTTWNAPNWVPQPGKQIAFNSCPNLSAASVNQILHRCVLNTSFTGPSSQVLLDGAAPTGTGITDKATLISRGCTVVTN